MNIPELEERITDHYECMLILRETDPDEAELFELSMNYHLEQYFKLHVGLEAA